MPPSPHPQWFLTTLHLLWGMITKVSFWVQASGSVQGWEGKVGVCVRMTLYSAVLSCSIVSDSASPWTVARQAPLSMELSLEYCSGLPFPSPGDLPNPGIEPRSPALQVNSLPTEPPGRLPVVWPPHAKSWVIGKDSAAGRGRGQEEKGTTEDETAGWHHRLDGRESERTPGDGDGQGGLACCDSWDRKESDTTERLNWTE